MAKRQGRAPSPTKHTKAKIFKNNLIKSKIVLRACFFCFVFFLFFVCTESIQINISDDLDHRLVEMISVVGGGGGGGFFLFFFGFFFGFFLLF